MKNLHLVFLLLFIWANGSLVFAQKKSVAPADLPHSAARILAEQLAKLPAGYLKKGTATADRGGADYRLIASRKDNLHTPSGNWDLDDSSQYFYDDKNRLVNQTNRTFNGLNWVYSSQVLYSYDDNNNITELLAKKWIGSTWRNDIRYLLQYDTNNNLTLLVYQTTEIASWVNVYQDTDLYDANSVLIQSTRQNWDGIGWKNQNRRIYHYDANGSLTLNVYQIWNNVNWVNKEQILYVNNLDGKPVERINQSWNGNDWINFKRIISEYSGNLLMQELFEYWDSGSWGAAYQRFTYTYDNNGNQTLRLLEDWDGTFWQNNERITNTFDAANNLLSTTIQEWDGGVALFKLKEFLYTYDALNNITFDQLRFWVNGNLNTGYRNFYYYETSVGLFDKPAAGFDLQVAPNPGTGIFTLTVPVATDVQVQISDALGRQVFSQTSSGQAQARLDLNRLPEGNYVLQVISTDGRQVAQWLQIRR